MFSCVIKLVHEGSLAFLCELDEPLIQGIMLCLDETKYAHYQETIDELKKSAPASTCSIYVDMLQLIEEAASASDE